MERPVAFILLLLALPASLGQAQNALTALADDFNDIVTTAVDPNGWVGYRGLKRDPVALNRYLAGLSEISPTILATAPDEDQIAFWINAYNGLTLKAIVDHYPIQASFWRSRIYPKNSIRQIPGVWDRLRFRIAGEEVTLEQIEHEILRKHFSEPRIHMALVCAARGCPPLRNEAYRGDRLSAQLDDQTRRFLRNPSKFQMDRGRKTVWLSPIFKWFQADFTALGTTPLGRQRGSLAAVLRFIALHLEASDATFIRIGDYRLRFLDYDWSLNER